MIDGPVPPPAPLDPALVELLTWACQENGLLIAAGKTTLQKTPVVVAPKAGRNDPCPCGSEKKFKKCCGV
jgi:uncharacterized protein YecA (UPF0149 family)